MNRINDLSKILMILIDQNPNHSPSPIDSLSSLHSHLGHKIEITGNKTNLAIQARAKFDNISNHDSKSFYCPTESIIYRVVETGQRI